MAKSDEGKSRRGSDPKTSDTVFSGMGVPSLDPLFQASNRLLDAWLTVSSELLEFGKSRLDRGLEMQQAMARSSSLNEAFDLQAKFARSVVEDYLSEATKLADLGTRSLIDTFSPLQSAAKQEMVAMEQRAEAAE